MADEGGGNVIGKRIQIQRTRSVGGRAEGCSLEAKACTRQEGAVSLVSRTITKEAISLVSFFRKAAISGLRTENGAPEAPRGSQNCASRRV